MRDALYLAWRALAANRGNTAILVGSIALILYLPLGLRVLAARSSAELTTRAEVTPLVVGAKGSALELVLGTLYFESAAPAPTRHAEVDRVWDSGLADAIPLHLRFHARNTPIVGTTLDYFDFRGLEVAEGRAFATLGECVLGATAARELDLGPGDTVVSSPENVFDLAGVYPLEMTVVGVLAPAHTPDDRAIFVDLKTTWVIEGIGHGHQDLAEASAASAVLKREDGRITANASLRQFNRITAENADSFHFHGDRADHPVTAVLAVPPDEKSATILMGRYLARDERNQIVQPIAVMRDLIATVVTVEAFAVAIAVVLGVATAATTVLVFGLSLRLRAGEIETMHKIGGTRARVASIFALEIAMVLAAAVAIAAGLTLATSQLAPVAIRTFVLG